MNKFYFWMVGIALVFLPDIALADSSTALNSVTAALNLAIADTTTKLQAVAIRWLPIFLVLQYTMTNFGLLKSGADIEAVIGKLIAWMLWAAVCYHIMVNGSEFISKVSGGFFSTASDIAGGGGTFDAADIINKSAETGSNLITHIIDSASYVSLIPAGIFAGLLAAAIICVGALIAFKAFLIKVEVMLVIMMAPVSFSFLGLNALKEQGIAPFKSLISLMYRLFFLAVIISAMSSVGKNLDKVIDAVDPTSFVSGVWQGLFSAVMSFALLGYLAYKSDSMAANLASGSTNLGSGDSSSAAAMGAAMGGAIGAAITGGAGLAAAGASKVASMSEVIGAMRGSGGATNAGGGVGGTTPITPPPPKPASASASLGDKPPVRSGGDGGAGSGGDAPQKTGAEGGGSMSPSSAAQSIDNMIASGQASNPENAKAVSDHLKSMPDSSTSSGASDSNPSTQGGNGSTAGIGGGSGGLEKAVGDLVAAMNQPKKAGLRDNLRDMNRINEHERATTSVSINPNAE